MPAPALLGPTCAARPAPPVQVLGALASVMTVWLVTGILLFEAVQRIITPEPVDGKREWEQARGVGRGWGDLRVCSAAPPPPPRSRGKREW